MKTTQLKIGAMTLLPVAMFAISSCSSTIPGEQTTSVKTTATSTTVVDTFKATATVTAIDASNRKLKLTLSDGSRTIVKCGPEVRNFAQIHINDIVNVVMTEEIAAYLDKGKSVGVTGAAAVGVAPLGAKPGAIMADTVQGTVKITAIDTAHRKVTFVNREGKSKTLKVGDHINLARVKVGDTVTIRQTEAVAVTVGKP